MGPFLDKRVNQEGKGMFKSSLSIMEVLSVCEFHKMWQSCAIQDKKHESQINPVFIRAILHGNSPANTVTSSLQHK